MVQLGLVLPQVNLTLQVRKADLSVLSTKEADMLLRNIMIMIRSLTMNKGYSVKTQVMLDGVMTSTNA